jgi:hypothetical protein
MRELLVGPAGNLLDGRDAQNVDFRNQYAGRSLAHSVASRFDLLDWLSRKLSAEAPALPLPDCDVATCTCRHAHYSDRRSGIDRRAVYDLDRERDAEFVNRRRNHGRRSTDARVWSRNGPG